MPKLSISRDEWLNAATWGDLEKLDKWFRSGALDVRYDPVLVGVSGRQGRARIFDVCSPDKQNALYMALSAGQVDYALMLLDIGKFPATRTTEGKTAMHAAATLGQRADEVIPRLVEQKYELDVQDKKGKTPLLEAISRKCVPTVAALLNAGACPDPIDEGHSPLVQSISKSQPEVLELLLKKGANPNLREDSEWGATPLHHLAACWDRSDQDATDSRNNQMMRMLVEANADPELTMKERNDKEMSVWDTFYRPGGPERLREMLATKQANNISSTTPHARSQARSPARL